MGMTFSKEALESRTSTSAPSFREANFESFLTMCLKMGWATSGAETFLKLVLSEQGQLIAGKGM